MAELRPAPMGYPIKLVRDHTAEVVNPTGAPGDLWYEQGPPEEHLRLLRLKLAEEVGEYLVDGGYDELSDVLAVVEGLAHAHGGSLGGLRAVMDCDRRGAFKRGVVMYGRHEEFDRAEAPDSGAVAHHPKQASS